MRTGFSPARCIALGVALGFAGFALGQSSTNSSLATYGANPVGSVLPSGGSPSGGPSSGGVSGSVDASSPGITVNDLAGASGASVVNGAVTAVPTGGGGGSHGSGGQSAAFNAGASSFQVSSSGWGNGSAMPQPQGFGASMPSGSMHSARGAAKSSSGSPAPAATTSKAALSALRSQNPGIASRLAKQNLSGAPASTMVPGGHATSSSKSENSTTSGVTGGQSGGEGSYSTGFPDSTKGTAMLSPPDLADNLALSFTPTTDHSFPDLADHGFLKPTLQVSGRYSSRKKNNEDLYSRIEDRIRAYQEAAAPKNGLEKTKKSTSHGFQNPFAEKPFGDEFGPKKPTSDSNF